MKQVINKNADDIILLPKTHRKFIYKYCEARHLAEGRRIEKNEAQEQMRELEEEKEAYEKTGAVSKEFMVKLFESREAILNMGGWCRDYLLESYERDSGRYESELKERGYNTEEIYNRYRENYMEIDF